MNTPLQPLPETVEFRFFVDFVIKIQPKELGSFTEEQTTMLKAIVTSPATLRKIVTCSPRCAQNRVRFSYSGVRTEHVEEQAHGGADDCCAEAG